MLTVDEARDIVLARARRLPPEPVALLDALGRFLAEQIVSDINMPPFDNSAVDGYAVRSADVAAAGPDTPVMLRTLHDVPAGALPAETVLPGTAARVMTGAPIPAGADAMVMVEDTQPGADGTVVILRPSGRGRHIRQMGEDVRRGTVVLAPGARIRSAEIAMLATMGCAVVTATRAPRVAIVTTGDEIVDIEAEAPLPPGRIRNSNRYGLAALVREAGAIVHSVAHVPDDPTATEEALRAAADPLAGADAIVAAGGVSIGDRDFVKPAVEKLGRMHLWRVAVKPGKPFAFGEIGQTLFFGLPGNPVSAMVTFELFVRQALLQMAGRAAAGPDRMLVRATLIRPIRHVAGRREYVRAITTFQGGRFVTRPTGEQGSGILGSMTLANSLCVLPEESAGAGAGDEVEVILLEGLAGSQPED
jgi:molybdopterin molybdotransferase